MTGDRSLTPERRRELAAEHALGLLQGDERAQAIALARNDAEFGRDVARWRGRLRPALDDVAEAEPSERIWPAIEERIGAVPAQARVIQLTRRLSRWRSFAAAASAIAAALALILLLRPPSSVQPTPPQPAPMVATLASDETADRLVATWDPGKRSLIVAAAAGMQATPGKVHELWVIPAGRKPMAVGIMRPQRPMRMTLPMPIATQLNAGAMLAVSIEPPGGSPTGLPTGPVIATGALQQT